MKENEGGGGRQRQRETERERQRDRERGINVSMTTYREKQNLLVVTGNSITPGEYPGHWSL